MSLKPFKVAIGKLSVNSPSLWTDNVPQTVGRVVDALKQPLVTHKEPYGSRFFLWGLEAAESYTVGNNIVYIGTLIRIKEGQIELWDPKNISRYLETVPNMVSDDFHYLFEPQSELVIIELRSNVHLDKLLTMFQKTITTNAPLIGDIAINPFHDEKNLLEAINKILKLRKLTFELIPSNPGMEKPLNTLENALVQARVLKSKMEFTGEAMEFKGTILEEAARKVVKADGKLKAIGEGPNASQVEVSSKTHVHTAMTKIENDTKEGKIKGLIHIFREKIDNFLSY